MLTRFARQQTRTIFTSRSVLSSVEGQAKQDPKIIEQERRRQDEAGNKNEHGEDVSPHDHAPGWNPTLATSSEEAAKADRDPHATPEELAKNANKTAEKVNKDTGNI